MASLMAALADEEVTVEVGSVKGGLATEAAAPEMAKLLAGMLAAMPDAAAS